MLMAVAGSAIGWFIKSMMRSIDRLDADVRSMPDKYISKSDFKEHLQRIENSLERIFEKLDDKQDK
jgi:molecular chaperone GrpE (heat shock protein)